MKAKSRTLFNAALASAIAIPLRSVALLGALALISTPAAALTPAEARAIAKEAYIYGYPMVDTQGTILILPPHLLAGRSSPGRLLDGSETGDGELKKPSQNNPISN